MKKIYKLSLALAVLSVVAINPIYSNAIGEPVGDVEVGKDQEKGSIKGIAKNQIGTPLEGIVVSLENTSFNTVTDANGYFELKGINSGDYKLLLTSFNVQPIARQITIVGNKQLSLNLTLNETAKELVTVEVTYFLEKGVAKQISRMKEIEGTIITAGKKTEVISMDNLDGALVNNNTRQAFAKIPGVSIWENDGSGIQVAVATRGLSPNRSWEFNVRQNSVDISSDVFGYPEAYYNPPMEAVESIQLLRGASSLQFGPQFGGMLNYQLKKAPTDKEFQFETQNTAGSYGLLSSFNAIGGTIGKFSYYAYHHQRSAEGWRQNGRFNIRNNYVNLAYAFSDKVKLTAEVTSMDYVLQQPAGLTDAQFKADPRQSLRSRNWFSTPWLVPALNLDAQLGENTKLNIRTFGLVAERNSIGFTPAITTPDTFNIAAGGFNSRAINRDFYYNIGGEARILHEYEMLGNKNALSVGVRYFRGNTRRVTGTGDRGSQYNMDLTTPDFNRDLNFITNNAAVFAENLFRIGERLSVTPGIRVENVVSEATGRLSRNFATGVDANINKVTNTNTFVLGGIGLEYKVTNFTSIYANASQSFRPVLYSQLTQSTLSNDSIDANLKNSSGYNLDLGYRGNVGKWLSFDLGYFYLNYDNRIGTLMRNRPNGGQVQLSTNIGRSVSTGFEGYIEVDPIKALNEKTPYGSVSLFSSFGLIDATYQQLNVMQAGNEVDLKGNRVEYAPQQTIRAGATYILGQLSITYQISSVSEVFTDAANTVNASANGQNGRLDGYQVHDLAGTYNFLKNYNIRAGINNLTDSKYITRRTAGYPGPGVIPGEGRTFFVSVGAKF